jgi:DNA-binding MarR family transcriptional regulator
LFESAIGFAALKPEAKILFALGSLGDMSIKQAMLISDVSYRGFYLILERLRNNQLIEIYPDSLDRRVRRIKLLVDIPQNL